MTASIAPEIIGGETEKKKLKMGKVGWERVAVRCEDRQCERNRLELKKLRVEPFH